MQLEYVRPASLAEAMQFLAEHGPQARLLAGGTDLVLEMQIKKVRPRYVVDIGRLSELRGIRQVEEQGARVLEIGALTSIREIETSPLLGGGLQALAQAAASLASVQIRNRATLGGNISHAAPSADTAPALLALGAEVEIAGPTGRYTLPLERFFVGPGKTVLDACQILTAFRMRVPGPGSGSVYIKHSPRRAMDCAVVGVAAAVELSGGRPIALRIALGAVAPTPIRSYKAEQALMGCTELSSGMLAEAAAISASEAQPIDDIRASAWYRRRMVQVNARRAIERALAQATQSASGGTA